jgi:hypothetical protein
LTHFLYANHPHFARKRYESNPENHDSAEALTVRPEPRFYGEICPLAARFQYYI